MPTWIVWSDYAVFALGLIGGMRADTPRVHGRERLLRLLMAGALTLWLAVYLVGTARSLIEVGVVTGISPVEQGIESVLCAVGGCVFFMAALKRTMHGACRYLAKRQARTEQH